MAFWFANACYADNLRESYIYALKKFIEIDDFGDCYDKICARGDPAECYFNQASNYWFYLAFENSNCPDYITEKLWRILDLPVVPIVMGGGNYRRDAPPHSVIDVNDFPHVKGLASYLNFLMKNPVRFRFPT